jgi:hypothetical protein
LKLRKAYKISVRGPEGRRLSHGWEDNIKLDLKERWYGDVDWIHLVQDRDQWQALVNTVKNLQVP